jgi:hypothetical protein
MHLLRFSFTFHSFCQVKSFPDNPPHYLNTTKATTISLISTSDLNAVSPYDVIGRVVGISDTYHYTR